MISTASDETGVGGRGGNPAIEDECSLKTPATVLFSSSSSLRFPTETKPKGPRAA